MERVRVASGPTKQ